MMNKFLFQILITSSISQINCFANFVDQEDVWYKIRMSNEVEHIFNFNSIHVKPQKPLCGF